MASVPGVANDVPASGNCFYTAVIFAIKDLIKRKRTGTLAEIISSLGLDSLTVKDLRLKTPDFVAEHLQCEKKDIMKSTWQNLHGSWLQNDGTYQMLVQSLPHVLVEQYAEVAPESAEELTAAWISCITESKTYACEIAVKAVIQALKLYCDIEVDLIMCSSHDDARANALYTEGTITLIHIMFRNENGEQYEHYNWVSPRPDRLRRHAGRNLAGQNKKRRQS